MLKALLIHTLNLLETVNSPEVHVIKQKHHEKFK
jgi:hypothetical protein